MGCRKYLVFTRAKNGSLKYQGKTLRKPKLNPGKKRKRRRRKPKGILSRIRKILNA